MDDPARAVGLHAAAITVDLTPPVGYYLGGYGDRKDPSNAVRDPLRGRLLLLDNGETRLVLVTLDLLSIQWQSTQQIRRGLEERIGVPPAHVLVNYSHTHAGPDVLRYDGYVSQVVEKVIGAGQEASSLLEPVTIVYDEDAIEFNINRRLKGSDGTVRMAPNPEGPVDRRVRVLRVQREDGSPLAILFHAVCHANALRADNLAISADFPGVAQDFLRAVFGPFCVPMFIQGCTGNVRANLPGETGFRSADEADLLWCGYSLGAAAARAAARAATRERVAAGVLGAALGGVDRILPLPGREAGMVDYPVQAVRIGSLLLIGLPGEPVVDYALRLEQMLEGWQQIVVAGYCNARSRYLATAQHYAEGGYEALARSSPYAPEAEEVLLAAVTDLVQTL
ncbi:MAG: hypothetical protein HPY83_06810 [Anaerolineae bacterium]|nr:hypothetical protein [Anaerolineae bacterium]